jgi:hypothetical protein
MPWSHLWFIVCIHILSGRLSRQALLDKTDTINLLSQTFVDLKNRFDSAINIQTAFVSFRISEGVEKIGAVLY